MTETVRHYNLWKQGFAIDEKWNLLGHRHSFSHQAKGDNSSDSPFGHGFLRRFQSPTIFLKIACDGDLLLPIIVGMSMLSKLRMCTMNNFWIALVVISLQLYL